MRYHGNAPRRRTSRLRQRLTAGGVCVALLLIFLRVDAAVRPTVTAAAALTVQNRVTEIFCEAATQSMAEMGPAQYVTFVYAQDGTVAAVDASATAVNRLQTLLTAYAGEALRACAAETISVPLGAAGEWVLLAGRGPTLRVRIRPVGAVTPELISDFSDAGVNQTLHRLSVRLCGSVQVIAPLCRDTIAVEYTFFISETLLVGRVPDFMLAGGVQP